ncbi:hypothetical protein DFR70_102219 [Nocardia tenerifensis]|uniref:YbaB/EbfC DNA-binding family protein n=1 Tax=Nocardia tenerifensis TaxID=228006 RepID=A0A318KJG0_9NOCA|nr:hypothetical protein [Nocardia tenerifensis]PXX68537.1 hypothetical protein DFR70_102219 [Nocardia tenerifensis]
MHGDFEELGRKVQRAQYAMAQVRGIGVVRGVSVIVDAENRLLSIDVPNATAIIEAYQAALRDKEPKAAAAMRELNADARLRSVRTFTEANSARLEAERRLRAEPGELYDTRQSWSVFE